MQDCDTFACAPLPSLEAFESITYFQYSLTVRFLYSPWQKGRQVKVQNEVWFSYCLGSQSSRFIWEAWPKTATRGQKSVGNLASLALRLLQLFGFLLRVALLSSKSSLLIDLILFPFFLCVYSIKGPSSSIIHSSSELFPSLLKCFLPCTSLYTQFWLWCDTRKQFIFCVN